MELTKSNPKNEQSQNYKQTKVGLIPEDWSEINLGNSSILKARIGWQGLTTAEYLNTGEFYLITGTDFLNGFIDWDNCVFVEKERYEQDKYIQVDKGDILVTKDGTIGKVAYVDNVPLPTTLNSGVFVIRPIRDNYDPKYFYHVLMSKHFRNFLGKLTAGSTISHLYQKDFVYYNFPLPPTLTEQRAIADALSDVDALLSSLEQLISKKQAIKQGAMQELLTPPSKGGKRLPGFSEEWEEIRLGKWCEFYKGKGLPKSEIVEDGRFRCIHYGELFTKYDEIIKCVESRTNKFENTFTSRSNDVLMPTSDVTPNGLATASAIFEDDVILGGDVLVIRSNKKLHGSFLAFQVYANRQQIMSLVSGSTVYHLYGSDMAKFKFFTPKIKEQKAIAQVLSDMDQEIEVLEEKKAKYQKVKKGMMQELLTGKIRLV